MHIALFTDFHPGTVGGIQTSVAAQYRGARRLGHRVTVFTAPGPESTEPDPELVVLSPVRALSVNGFAAVLPTRANARLIDAVFAERGPVDIVHTQTTYGVAVAGVKAARRHGIPLVQTIHSRDDVFIQHTSPAPYPAALVMRALHNSVLPHRGRMPRNPEPRAARHAWHTMIAQAQAADAVIVPSAHFAERLRAHGLAGRLHVVSNGVDDDLLDEPGATVPPAEERRAADSSGATGSGHDPDGAGPLRVLWCARLSAEKRPLAAIEAVLRVPGAVLDVYGDGDQLAAARELAGDDPRIHFHGARAQRDCLRAMRDHDILLFPSLGFDTQGMALLEAAATGLPVLYCDAALGESVPPGGGILTAPEPAAIAAALRALAESPAELETLRDAVTATEFSARQSVLSTELIGIYTDLLTDPPGARMPRTPAEVPTAPGRLPLLGHSIAALRDSLGFVRSLAAVGPVVRVYLGPRPAYVLTTPELVRQVGFGTAGEFHRDDLRAAMHEVVRGASNVLSGTPHELRRRMIAPALRRRRLQDYAAVTAAIADDWAEALPGTVNLMESAHALVLDTISATLFTADFGAAAKAEVRQNIPWLLAQVVQRAALPDAVNRARFLADRRFAAKAAALRGEIGAVVRAYRADGRDHRDVLSALIGHVDAETGATLGDEEIVDELILMLAAGVGSTASILAWVWYETLRSPDIRKAVRAELDTEVGAGPVEPDHLFRLPYLRRVILETLRYWGPWVSTQNADGPVTFDGLTLPDGAMIVYSPYLVHHDPRYYPDPARFDPERWAPERVDDIDRKAVLPFGVGARHCPGNNFALLTITLATAALFTHWDPVLDSGYRVKPSSGDFVAAPSRLPVTLRPRTGR
ncbi:cytochrome P450 [Nocardia asteroides]|uniref:cytochrome P450 n=1 Tax=Nocardia asteroides TaxID=1824 RepID=UPI001E32EB94|nr:cytochrome P450 [Nocardia asteroides]UGT61222.1 cytochrome P450 [Nocardia asteroides]